MKTVLIKYFCAFIIVCTVFSCSKDDDNPVEPIDPGTPNELSITDEILKLVNEHRKNNGISELIKNQTAEELAIDHTKYMISINEINHDNFDAKFKVLKEKENARTMGENVAAGYRDAESVMKGWLESQGHRENIEGNYTHIGIAAIKNDRGQYYYTQIFYR
jgi:uncharacterized protein YkwD